MTRARPPSEPVGSPGGERAGTSEPVGSPGGERASPARWIVTVDKAACIGSAVCVGTAPGRFALDDRHRSGPVRREIAPDEAVRGAAASCPVEAIGLVDADTGEPVELG